MHDCVRKLGSSVVEVSRSSTYPFLLRLTATNRRPTLPVPVRRTITSLTFQGHITVRSFMNYGQRLVGIALLSVTITGCTSDIAKPVGLDVALRGVEEDMKAASGVSLHDVLSRDAIQEDEFNRAILQAQCFYRRPNPLVPVMIKDFTLTLQGRSPAKENSWCSVFRFQPEESRSAPRRHYNRQSSFRSILLRSHRSQMST